MAEFSKILVPFDGSSQSVNALKTAIGVAKLYRAKLDVLFVLEHVRFAGTPTDTLYIIEQATKQVKELAIKKAKHILKQEGFKGEVASSEGHPTEEIIEFAEKGKYDLVIIGNRGLSDVDRFLLGSVSDGVARHVHCAVMIVK